MAVHTGVGGGDGGVFGAAGGVVAILAVNFVGARVKLVAECDGLVGLVVLLAPHVDGVVHGFVAENERERKYEERDCAFAGEGLCQGALDGCLPLLHPGDVAEVVDDAHERKCQKPEYDGKADKEPRGAGFFFGWADGSVRCACFGLFVVLLVDKEDDALDLVVREAGEVVHQRWLPFCPQFVGIGVAAGDERLRVANPRIQVFARVGCPTLLHAAEGGAGESVLHVFVVAGGAVGDEEVFAFFYVGGCGEGKRGCDDKCEYPADAFQQHIVCSCFSQIRAKSWLFVSFEVVFRQRFVSAKVKMAFFPPNEVLRKVSYLDAL